MRVSVALIAVLLSGCGASGLAIVNGSALAASGAALACDWGQTRSYAADDWHLGHRENNPIMGPTPEPSVVDAYFLGALALTTLAWRVTPRRFRAAVPLVVLAIQVSAVRHNLSTKVGEPSMCGL